MHLRFGCLILPLLFWVTPLRAQTAVDRGFRFAADGVIVGAPIVEDDGTVFCATDGGTLYAVASAGDVRWSVRLGGRPLLLTKTGDGIILAATVKGYIEGYNRRGSRVVDFAAAPNGAGILAVFETPEGRILTALRNGTFILFTPAGKQLHSWKTRVPFSCSPALSPEGLIACGTADGLLSVYSLSGIKIREFSGGSMVQALAWDGPESFAAAKQDGGVFFFSLEGTENPLGSFYGKIGRIQPLPSGETLLLGDGGDLILLDTAKKEKWSLRGRNIIGLVHDREGNIFAAGSNGDISGFDIRGSRLWTASLQGIPGHPGIAENGRYLAVGGSNWVVHVFEFLRYGEKAVPLGTISVKHGPLNTDPAGSAYKKDFDYIFLMDRAASPYPNRKIECLAELEDRFSRGRMGKSLDYVLEILAYLVLEPYPGRTFSGGRSAPDLPDIRGRAVRLLGRMGSRIGADFLLEILSYESDDTVVSEIIRALGSMKRDPDRAVRQGILKNLFSRAALPPAYTVQSVLDTLESILNFQGDGLGPAERSILFRIMAGPYPRNLRLAAEELSRKE